MSSSKKIIIRPHPCRADYVSGGILCRHALPEQSCRRTNGTDGAEGSIAAAADSVAIPVLLLSILTAGITEEILYRGYPLERLTELTGSRWTAAILSLIAFILPHLSGWNLAHIVGVVLPLGTALTAIYFWRRDLLFNMIVHTMINLPLLFIALGS